MRSSGSASIEADSSAALTPPSPLRSSAPGGWPACAWAASGAWAASVVWPASGAAPADVAARLSTVASVGAARCGACCSTRSRARCTIGR